MVRVDGVKTAKPYKSKTKQMAIIVNLLYYRKHVTIATRNMVNKFWWVLWQNGHKNIVHSVPLRKVIAQYIFSVFRV